MFCVKSLNFLRTKVSDNSFGKEIVTSMLKRSWSRFFRPNLLFGVIWFRMTPTWLCSKDDLDRLLRTRMAFWWLKPLERKSLSKICWMVKHDKSPKWNMWGQVMQDGGWLVYQVRKEFSRFWRASRFHPRQYPLNKALTMTLISWVCPKTVISPSLSMTWYGDGADPDQLTGKS